MYSWDIAAVVAAHYERPWQEREAERTAARDRLMRAIGDEAVPAKVRRRLATRVTRRMLDRHDHYYKERAVGRDVVAIVTAVESGATVPDAVLERCAQSLVDAERTVETWTKWGEGCELETAQQDRAMLAATVALGHGADDWKTVVTAALEHAGLHDALEVYGHALREGPMALVHHVGYLREAATILLDLFAAIADG